LVEHSWSKVQDRNGGRRPRNGLRRDWPPSEARLSWETVSNVLKQHVRFFLELGEKPSEINSAQWTLNQRVPGSSPGAPTNYIKYLV
jgi:hypothetical protein